MVLDKGEKVFIVTRRHFANDLRRHFVGEVLESTDTVARVRGYVFVYDAANNYFVRRDEVRTRIFSLTDAGFIINVLPREVILDKIRYLVNEKKQGIITDEKTFIMDVSEFSDRK